MQSKQTTRASQVLRWSQMLFSMALVHCNVSKAVGEGTGDFDSVVFKNLNVCGYGDVDLKAKVAHHVSRLRQRIRLRMRPQTLLRACFLRYWLATWVPLTRKSSKDDSNDVIWRACPTYATILWGPPNQGIDKKGCGTQKVLLPKGYKKTIE